METHTAAEQLFRAAVLPPLKHGLKRASYHAYPLHTSPPVNGPPGVVATPVSTLEPVATTSSTLWNTVGLPGYGSNVYEDASALYPGVGTAAPAAAGTAAVMLREPVLASLLSASSHTTQRPNAVRTDDLTLHSADLDMTWSVYTEQVVVESAFARIRRKPMPAVRSNEGIVAGASTHQERRPQDVLLVTTRSHPIAADSSTAVAATVTKAFAFTSQIRSVVPVVFPTRVPTSAGTIAVLASRVFLLVALANGTIALVAPHLVGDDGKDDRFVPGKANAYNEAIRLQRFNAKTNSNTETLTSLTRSTMGMKSKFVASPTTVEPVAYFNFAESLDQANVANARRGSTLDEGQELQEDFLKMSFAVVGMELERLPGEPSQCQVGDLIVAVTHTRSVSDLDAGNQFSDVSLLKIRCPSEGGLHPGDNQSSFGGTSQSDFAILHPSLYGSSQVIESHASQFSHSIYVTSLWPLPLFACAFSNLSMKIHTVRTGHLIAECTGDADSCERPVLGATYHVVQPRPSSQDYNKQADKCRPNSICCIWTVTPAKHSTQLRAQLYLLTCPSQDKGLNSLAWLPAELPKPEENPFLFDLSKMNSALMSLSKDFVVFRTPVTVDLVPPQEHVDPRQREGDCIHISALTGCGSLDTHLYHHLVCPSDAYLPVTSEMSARLAKCFAAAKEHLDFRYRYSDTDLQQDTDDYSRFAQVLHALFDCVGSCTLSVRGPPSRIESESTLRSYIAVSHIDLAAPRVVHLYIGSARTSSQLSNSNVDAPDFTLQEKSSEVQRHPVSNIFVIEMDWPQLSLANKQALSEAESTFIDLRQPRLTYFHSSLSQLLRVQSKRAGRMQLAAMIGTSKTGYLEEEGPRVLPLATIFNLVNDSVAPGLEEGRRTTTNETMLHDETHLTPKGMLIPQHLIEAVSGTLTSTNHFGFHASHFWLDVEHPLQGVSPIETPSQKLALLTQDCMAVLKVTHDVYQTRNSLVRSLLVGASGTPHTRTQLHCQGALPSLLIAAQHSLSKNLSVVPPNLVVALATIAPKCAPLLVYAATIAGILPPPDYIALFCPAQGSARAPQGPSFEYPQSLSASPWSCRFPETSLSLSVSAESLPYVCPGFGLLNKRQHATLEMRHFSRICPSPALSLSEILFRLLQLSNPQNGTETRAQVYPPAVALTLQRRLLFSIYSYIHARGFASTILVELASLRISDVVASAEDIFARVTSLASQSYSSEDLASLKVAVQVILSTSAAFPGATLLHSVHEILLWVETELMAAYYALSRLPGVHHMFRHCEQLTEQNHKAEQEVLHSVEASLKGLQALLAAIAQRRPPNALNEEDAVAQGLCVLGDAQSTAHHKPSQFTPYKATGFSSANLGMMTPIHKRGHSISAGPANAMEPPARSALASGSNQEKLDKLVTWDRLITLSNIIHQLLNYARFSRFACQTKHVQTTQRTIKSHYARLSQVYASRRAKLQERKRRLEQDILPGYFSSISRGLADEAIKYQWKTAGSKAAFDSEVDEAHRRQVSREIPGLFADHIMRVACELPQLARVEETCDGDPRLFQFAHYPFESPNEDLYTLLTTLLGSTPEDFSKRVRPTIAASTEYLTTLQRIAKQEGLTTQFSTLSQYTANKFNAGASATSASTSTQQVSASGCLVFDLLQALSRVQAAQWKKKCALLYYFLLDIDALSGRLPSNLPSSEREWLNVRSDEILGAFNSKDNLSTAFANEFSLTPRQCRELQLCWLLDGLLDYVPLLTEGTATPQVHLKIRYVVWCDAVYQLAMPVLASAPMVAASDEDAAGRQPENMTSFSQLNSQRFATPIAPKASSRSGLSTGRMQHTPIRFGLWKTPAHATSNSIPTPLGSPAVTHLPPTLWPEMKAPAHLPVASPSIVPSQPKTMASFVNSLLTTTVRGIHRHDELLFEFFELVEALLMRLTVTHAVKLASLVISELGLRDRMLSTKFAQIPPLDKRDIDTADAEARLDAAGRPAHLFSLHLLVAHIHLLVSQPQQALSQLRVASGMNSDLVVLGLVSLFVSAFGLAHRGKPSWSASYENSKSASSDMLTPSEFVLDKSPVEHLMKQMLDSLEESVFMGVLATSDEGVAELIDGRVTMHQLVKEDVYAESLNRVLHKYVEDKLRSVSSLGSSSLAPMVNITASVDERCALQLPSKALVSVRLDESSRTSHLIGLILLRKNIGLLKLVLPFIEAIAFAQLFLTGDADSPTYIIAPALHDLVCRVAATLPKGALAPLPTQLEAALTRLKDNLVAAQGKYRSVGELIQSLPDTTREHLAQSARQICSESLQHIEKVVETHAMNPVAARKASHLLSSLAAKTYVPNIYEEDSMSQRHKGRHLRYWIGGLQLHDAMKAMLARTSLPRDGRTPSALQHTGGLPIGIEQAAEAFNELIVAGPTPFVLPKEWPAQYVGQQVLIPINAEARRSSKPPLAEVSPARRPSLALRSPFVSHIQLPAATPVEPLSASESSPPLEQPDRGSKSTIAPTNRSMNAAALGGSVRSEMPEKGVEVHRVEGIEEDAHHDNTAKEQETYDLVRVSNVLNLEESVGQEEAREHEDHELVRVSNVLKLDESMTDEAQELLESEAQALLSSVGRVSSPGQSDDEVSGPSAPTELELIGAKRRLAQRDSGPERDARSPPDAELDQAAEAKQSTSSAHEDSFSPQSMQIVEPERGSLKRIRREALEGQIEDEAKPVDVEKEHVVMADAVLKAIEAAACIVQQDAISLAGVAQDTDVHEQENSEALAVKRQPRRSRAKVNEASESTSNSEISSALVTEAAPRRQLGRVRRGAKEKGEDAEETVAAVTHEEKSAEPTEPVRTRRTTRRTENQAQRQASISSSSTDAVATQPTRSSRRTRSQSIVVETMDAAIKEIAASGRKQRKAGSAGDEEVEQVTTRRRQTRAQAKADAESADVAQTTTTTKTQRRRRV